MRIANLKIENFKSIKKLDLNFSQLCALIGPNSAGKTNILQAIFKFLGKDWISAKDFSDEDIYQMNTELDIKIQITFDPPISYSKTKNSPTVEIHTLSLEYTKYKIGAFKGSRRLEQKCLDAKGNQVVVQTKVPQAGQKPEFSPIIGIPQEIRDQIPIIHIDTNRNLESHLPTARYSLLRRLFEDVNDDFQKDSQTVDSPNASGEAVSTTRLKRFEALMEEVRTLLRTNEFQKLERSIKNNALSFLGLNPETDQDKFDLFFASPNALDFYKLLDLQMREGNFSISATKLGGGVQNAIVLALLKAYEERREQGAIFLIEEPEMFLHPQLQRSLYKTLRSLSETNQIIFSTHSPHFVSIPYFDEISLVRKDSNGTNVRRSDLTVDAILREKILKELDPERNECFFARRVLLVEGDTEKLALPEYAKRLDIDLDRSGATVIEVGGKRNLMMMAKILKSLLVPIGVIYDEDSTDFKGREDEEKEYNGSLDGLADTDLNCRVWMLSKNYEDLLRTTFGDTDYQRVCTKHGSISKAIRAKVIAAEELDLAVPNTVSECLKWISNTTV